MKSLLIGVVAFSSLVAGAAFAADMPLPYKAPPMAAPAPLSWTSCYLGGNVGVGGENTNVTDEVAGYEIATLSDSTIVGGGQVGCDYQFSNNWVIGIQGMYDGTGFKADTTSTALGPLTLHGSIPWFATLTGRLGYTVAPNWLLYAKGGGAWTHTDSTLYVTGVGTVIDSVGFDQSGWTAGGGAEWRINPYVSVFAEYDYLGFADKVVSFPNSNNIGNVHQYVQVGLVGLNFRLGAWR